MPLTPQITVTANLQQVTGVVDAASVTFELENFQGTIPRVAGTGVIVQTRNTVVADGSGNISITLWGEDVITPPNTFYTATFFNDLGAEVASVAYQFSGSGTFDLSNVLPMGELVAAPPAPNAAVPQAFTPLSHQFLKGMNSSGVFSAAQPAFSDISGVLAAAQLPAPSATSLGGVESIAPVSHQFLTGISTSGVPSAAQPTYGDIASGPVSATTGAFSDILVLTGNASLPASTGGSIRLAAGFSSPTAGRIFFGDGTGWQLFFSKRNTSVTTDLFTFNDNGNLSVTGQYQVNGAQIAASNLSNGVSGSGAVALVTSPTFTTPHIASIVNTGTLTLPTSTDTLVGRATTDTLTNKTLNAAVTGSTGLSFAGGTSGAVTLQSGVGVASGTVSIPSATDTLVCRATTDTLTNKTIGTGGLGGLTVGHQIFTSSGTFTIPAGVTNIKVTCTGGGGAGGGSAGSTAGAGGGSGGSTTKWLTGLTPGNTLAVTVGGAGAGVSGTTGGSGSASSVSSGSQTITTISANGGAGASSIPAAGAAAGSGGDINAGGNPGTPFSSTIGGGGGGSIFGGGGGAASGGTAGNSATAPGAAGGGAGGSGGLSIAGGNGGPGIVLIEWHA